MVVTVKSQSLRNLLTERASDSVVRYSFSAGRNTAMA